jgi:hypothetical protein
MNTLTKQFAVLSLFPTFDMDMSYTRVLHIKVAYMIQYFHH